MGKFKWFKRKKNVETPQEKMLQEEAEVQVQTELEEEKVNIKNPAERKAYVSQHCEQIVEATKQMDEFRKEYEAVTAYLSDIQVLDRIPESSRNEIDDTARNILTLTRERERFQNGQTKITQKQYKLMEAYEDEIPNEVKKINAKEAYQTALKKDLATLEGEKHSLSYEQSEITGRQGFLKLTSTVVCFLTAAVFLVLFLLSYNMDVEAKNPFILTVLLALVCAAYIANEARKNRVDMHLNQRKMTKAIGLMNRVKIRYVNNQLSLDYSYAKFNIKSSMQLTFFWEEYMKQKDINNRYKENTENLNYYSEKLVKQLKDYRLHDPEVWIHQCLAILEPKEMVEIRHRLNIRRQKLRERMDYNTQRKEESVLKIKDILKENPEAKEEIIVTMKKYNINL
ncbi:MAG: hypothetical protein Q4G58_11820 [bacterium]|nr:hypothetical protein [bacterium]